MLVVKRDMLKAKPINLFAKPVCQACLPSLFAKPINLSALCCFASIGLLLLAGLPLLLSCISSRSLLLLKAVLRDGIPRAFGREERGLKLAKSCCCRVADLERRARLKATAI